MKLNIGSGENKLEGYINIDFDVRFKPDLVLDIREGLPYKDNEVDEIISTHLIEHIEYPLWLPMFREFQRVLKPEGKLLLEYPEFEIVTRYFLTNHLGKRDFWRAVIYGGQAVKGDYHVTPVVTSLLIQKLALWGFKDLRRMDALHNYNSILVGRCGERYSIERAFKQDFFKITSDTDTEKEASHEDRILRDQPA